MLYNEQTVRDNIRTREGKRVFFLPKGGQLTSGARDYLTRERIDIRPGDEAKIDIYRLENGAYLEEKPEEMTHLQGNILVDKGHPRIRFRGKLDSLECELLLCQLALPKYAGQLGEILALTRRILQCEVLETPLEAGKLCGLTEAEIRRRSHFPQEHDGQPHFMPAVTDGEAVLRLNRVRGMVREAEIACLDAFRGPDGRCRRVDLLRAMNRMSGMVYLLMIQEKASLREGKPGCNRGRST